ncbi:sterile alpha motif domain-containing protein 1 [Danio aesculapii]|uniref:sterile alpha motif domain-containing protein 1 n=1 Tax=Danio aesculapii TaxID=1142201 RepID=UPI0024C00ECB|nr:sterile alpha motif domain-containing protein 1 [Danio aesculapii]
MSEPKYQEWILETIDSLRSRKARPDLERICRMVRRRHGSDPDQTRAELEKLIQEQTVLKVSYKGSISYRNAAKVQRKCRKRPEQTTDSSSGSGESVAEQTKHAAFRNTGDSSALSLTDQEEEECGDKEPEEPRVSPSPDPLLQSSPSTLEKEDKILPPHSGNSLVSCGATGCSAGSDKASASKERRSVSAAGGGGSGPLDASSAEGEEMLSAGHEGTDEEEKKEQKTCSSVSSPQKNRLSASSKLKLGVKGSVVRCSESPEENSTDLGDRLVDAVRSMSERHRGSAATRGHTPPGLKEILDYLCTQKGMPGEKLTRNRVKVVLEREIERGRLRRTRLGHITLPARGMGAAKPSARLLKSALQDRHLAKKEEVKDEDGMEVESEGNGTEEQTAEDLPETVPDEDGKTSNEPPSPEMEAESDRATRSPMMTCEGETQSSSSLQLSNHCSILQQADVGGSQEQTVRTEAEDSGTEKPADPSDQRHPSVEDQMLVMSETVKAPPSIPIRNCCKLEVGVSSCLLTPSASPGAAEERGMNEGIGFVKSEASEVSPVDWTVADVASYFTAAGFPEQALAFRTQEIDGKSLLLMQRNDVLTGLSIRLGPALKIYERHVKVLQKTHFQDDEAFC